MSADLEAVLAKPAFHEPLQDPAARIERERTGMPVKLAEDLRKQMGLSVPEFSQTLGIKLATYKKRVANKEPLTGRYGDAVADLGETLAVAQSLLTPEHDNFDVPRWFAEWITVPQPSLGGRKPSSILDTPTGRALVKRVVGAMGTGSYL